MISMPVFPDDPNQREFDILQTSEFGVCVWNQIANPGVRRRYGISAHLQLVRQGENVN